MRIAIMTVGSRGDVQPFVALGRGLARAGHDVTLATHARWERLARENGLRHAVLEGGFHRIQETEAGQAWMRAGSRPLAFLRTLYPATCRELRCQLEGSLTACEGAEALVFTPLVPAGWHLAGCRRLPCVGATLQPLLPTRSFPTPVLGSGRSLGPLNRLSHLAVDLGYAAAWRGEVNRWRREVLGVPPVPPGFRYSRLGARPLPMICGFSDAVIPRPPDWPYSTLVCGYWFLDDHLGWEPPADLAGFLAEGPAPVYAGFGSMVLGDPAAVRGLVVEAFARVGRRGVIALGEPTGRISREVFAVASVPHGWLFPRMAAVVHHGGAGTVAAGLRAGVPTVVVPFVADQFFWGERVHALGAGPRPVPFARLGAGELAAAIAAAAGDADMRRRAGQIGEAIRAEDGVARAVAALEAAFAAAG
jgi:sterol 3beta-glucosyltransferase